jgi:hypothetical protein
MAVDRRPTGEYAVKYISVRRLVLLKAIELLPGERFRKLVVCRQTYDRTDSRDRRRVWMCVCDCGKEVCIPANHLVEGRRTSCGCNMGSPKNPMHSGERYGRLTILEETAPSPQKGNRNCRRYLCKCDCGNVVDIRMNSLRRGLTKSCGCLQMESVKRTFTKHGDVGTRTYGIWASMIQRCHNPRNSNYASYGGRGIAVCKEWREDFSKFKADMGERPEGLTLERKDVNGPYIKGNCRWATPQDQTLNKTSSRIITFEGKSMPITEWARRLNTRVNTLRSRLGAGWSVEQTLTTPTKTEFRPKGKRDRARLERIKRKTPSGQMTLI